MEERIIPSGCERIESQIDYVFRQGVLNIKAASVAQTYTALVYASLNSTSYGPGEAQTDMEAQPEAQ